MQSRWIAIVFVAAGMAYGQTPCAGGAPPKNDPGCVSAVQYATCPKYQHIEKSTLRCPHAGQGLPKDVCEWSSDAREFCAKPPRSRHAYQPMESATNLPAHSSGNGTTNDPAPPQTERRPHQPPAPQGRTAGGDYLVVPGWIRRGLLRMFGGGVVGEVVKQRDGVGGVR